LLALRKYWQRFGSLGDIVPIESLGDIVN